MLHAKFTYLGSDSRDIVVLGDQHAMDQMIKISGKVWSNFFLFETLSDELWKGIRAARLMMVTGNILPCLEKMAEKGAVEFLELPVPLLSSAFTSLGQIQSLRTLRVTGEGKSRISKDKKLEQIIRLEAYDSSLDVCPDSIPKVVHLYIRDVPTGKMTQLLPEMQPLESLMLSPYHEEQIDQIKPDRIRYLSLVNGRSAGLSKITRLQGLTDLRLQNLPRLTSIAPLIELPLLSDLTIGYCNNIQDMEVLASLPKLQRVLIFASKCDKKRIREMLESKLLHVSVT